MFKRRRKRTWGESLAELIYPRGGWGRAASYIWHRLRRLPDPPHKISRGIAAGVFVCFTPFFGFHFLLAASLAFVMQGNMLAALLATFVGNPLTFPLIATVSVELGNKMLGYPGGIPLSQIASAFSSASVQIWQNLIAVFTSDVAHWDRLGVFFNRVFLPYLVGGIIPGIVTAIVFYYASHPLIEAYQKARIKRLKKRYEKRRELELSKADAPSKSG